MSICSKSKRSLDVTLKELERLGVRHEVRRLSVGDFLWICRCTQPADTGRKPREFVLPHIVERKRMDDLAGSIKDGRFHEQKFRLLDSGIANVVYMIESRGGGDVGVGLPIPTLLQAAANTQVQSGFVVQFSDSQPDSMRQLALMTELLHEMYAHRELLVCAGTTKPADEREADADLTDDRQPVRVLAFDAFTAATTKMRNFSVRDMFVRQLLQLKTLSVDKAMAIVRRYPTPSHLQRAYRECERSGAGGGETLLADLEFGALRKRIGPAISRSLYLLYTRRQAT